MRKFSAKVFTADARRRFLALGRAAGVLMVAAVATLAATPASARTLVQDVPPVVAVFFIQDFRTQNRLPEYVLEDLTNYLSVRLAEGGLYRLTPPARVRQALHDAKAQSYRACFDEACQIELGKALAAEKSLGTMILRVDSRTCAVTSTLYDLRTEVTERAATAEGDCDRDGIAASLREALSKLRRAEMGPDGDASGLSPDSTAEILRRDLEAELRRTLSRLGVKTYELKSDSQGAAALRRFRSAVATGDEYVAKAALRRVTAAARDLTHRPDFLRRRLDSVDALVARVAAQLQPAARAQVESRYWGLYKFVNEAHGLEELHDASKVIDQFITELRRFD